MVLRVKAEEVEEEEDAGEGTSHEDVLRMGRSLDGLYVEMTEGNYQYLYFFIRPWSLLGGIEILQEPVFVGLQEYVGRRDEHGVAVGMGLMAPESNVDYLSIDQVRNNQGMEHNLLECQGGLQVLQYQTDSDMIVHAVEMEQPIEEHFAGAEQVSLPEYANFFSPKKSMIDEVFIDDFQTLYDFLKLLGILQKEAVFDKQNPSQNQPQSLVF